MSNKPLESSTSVPYITYDLQQSKRAANKWSNSKLNDSPSKPGLTKVKTSDKTIGLKPNGGKQHWFFKKQGMQTKTEAPKSKAPLKKK